jgi:AcrR family transcriptional regulator
MNKKHEIVRKQKKRVDRRIQRTRQLLREALTSLILEKGYEATTVQEILDRANIGRSTFYSHFRDKDELLVSGFEQFREMVEEFDGRFPHRPNRSAQKYSPALFFFHHAAQNHRLYKSMITSELVQNYLYKFITQIAGSHIKGLVPAGKRTPVPQELIVHYLVSSYLGTLTWWVNHDMPCSPEEILEMYHRLTLPGINAGLGKTK